MSATIEFDGEPFDPIAPAPRTPTPAPTTPTSYPGGESAVRATTGPTEVLVRLRTGLVAAHASALAAQNALAHRLLDGGSGPIAPGGATGPAALAGPSGLVGRVGASTVGEPPAVPAAPTREAAFKPPARPARRDLDRAALAALAAGDVAGVFGERYDQRGANPEVRTHGGHLAAVADLDVRGGAGRRGSLRATLAEGASGAGAAVEAVEVLAIALGLPLVLAGTALEHTTGEPHLDGADLDGAELTVEATAVDLIPRPHVAALVVVRRAGEVLGRVPDVVVTVRELPGVTVAPDAAGRLAHPGRRCSEGETALLGEFHFTHMSRGEPGIAHGPQFAHLLDRRATRLPSHGLQFVDRVVSIDGERGAPTGATYVTEYDAPADSWYFADSANADTPNVVLMETSLQSALLVGYHLGATLSDPGQDYVLRNLGGTATLRSELDLRDRTIRQHSRITATTPTSGSILQEFTYSLTVDGEPYYDGESMFGFFTAATMANQTGLDGGRTVPTWLDVHDPPARRILDVAARRDDRSGDRSTDTDAERQRRHSADIPAADIPAPVDHLAMLDRVTVVDGGGDHGQGYLHVAQPIDPDAWYFARHFHLDPVVPGSLGVEQVLQAMQEWALDAGLAAELDAPEFVVPVGVPLTWRYRGQVLPTDGTVTFEVHLTRVERRPGRVRVGATASLWKPGLRIYELEGATVELRERGAPAWQ